MEVFAKHWFLIAIGFGPNFLFVEPLAMFSINYYSYDAMMHVINS